MEDLKKYQLILFSNMLNYLQHIELKKNCAKYLIIVKNNPLYNQQMYRKKVLLLRYITHESERLLMSALSNVNTQ